MTSHRTISLTTASLLAALVAVAPVSASANSLLSGYGGPGAGNQAILGSALIGGGGSAGGSSGSGGSTGSTGSSSGAGTGATAGSGATGAAAGEVTSGGARGAGAQAGSEGGGAAGGRTASGAAGARGGHGGASGGAARAYPVRPFDVAAKPSPAGSGALGVSVADFGYLVLVLALLGVTGIVTRRLARAPASRPEVPR